MPSLELRRIKTDLLLLQKICIYGLIEFKQETKTIYEFQNLELGEQNIRCHKTKSFTSMPGIFPFLQNIKNLD